MKLSAQVSLYPLREPDIGPAIESFAAALREAGGLEVDVGPMSTLLVGDSGRLFAALGAAFERAASGRQVVMTVTFSNACPLAAGAPGGPGRRTAGT